MCARACAHNPFSGGLLNPQTEQTRRRKKSPTFCPPRRSWGKPNSIDRSGEGARTRFIGGRCGLAALPIDRLLAGGRAVFPILGLSCAAGPCSAFERLGQYPQ